MQIYYYFSLFLILTLNFITQMKNIFNLQENQELITRINQLTPNSKAIWGIMTVDQMLNHCNDAVLVAFNEKELQVSVFFQFLGKLLKNSVLNSVEFKKNSPTAKEFKYNSNFDFDTIQKELVKNIERFQQGSHVIKCHKHPFWGKMNSEDWNKLMWKHLDHHLRQFGV